MVSDLFDSLAKALAQDTSRRSALKGAAVVGAGGLLTLMGRGGASADACPRNRPVKCRGECFPRGFVCDKDATGGPHSSNRGQAKQD
jgi:hypothetical protein